MGKNVIIQFVPIMKDPLADFNVETKEAGEKSWFKSVVVLRIIVRPTRADTEYIYPVGKISIKEKQSRQ